MTDSRPQIEAHTRFLSTELVAAAEKGLGPWMLVMSERMARVEAKQDFGIMQLDIHSDDDEKRFESIGQQINIAISTAAILKDRDLEEVGEKRGRKKLLLIITAIGSWIVTTGLAIWAAIHKST